MVATKFFTLQRQQKFSNFRGHHRNINSEGLDKTSISFVRKMILRYSYQGYEVLLITLVGSACNDNNKKKKNLEFFVKQEVSVTCTET